MLKHNEEFLPLGITLYELNPRARQICLLPAIRFTRDA